MNTRTAIFGVIGALMALSSTSGAASACATTTWTKTSGTSLAATIRGRDCGGTYSVRFINPGGDTGWVPMFKNGSSDYRAQWGDGQVLTDINMKVNGANMSAKFFHKSANGTSTTQGTYQLTGF